MLGPDHPVTGESLGALAIFLREVGRFEEARVMYEKAIPILEESQDLEQLGLAWGGLSLTLSKLSRPGEALLLSWRYLEYLEERDPQSGRAKLFPLFVAHIHALLGDFGEARRHYRRAIQSLAGDGLDGVAAGSVPANLNAAEVGLMYELATLVRDAGEADDALRLFGIVAQCTDAVIMTRFWQVYPDQELPEKIHADYATLLRRAGRDAEADVEDANVEKFRARRVRMSRPR